MTMNAVATLETETEEDLDTYTRPQRTASQQDEPRQFPMHIIIVYNDNDHSFEYAMELFAKVFRYSYDKCRSLALHIHHEGRTVVWNGTKELGELKIEQIKNGGPDMWGVKRVDYPLNCELQPVD
jgi:ATP-dependent Clp protease adaptor protein ClpS